MSFRLASYVVIPVVFLAGGWALTTLGPRIAFDVTAVVQILAAVPLFATPNVSVARQAPGVLSAAFPGILMFAVDGFIAAGFYFVWQIALFLSLGESFSAFGAAMALAGIVGALGGLLLGRHIDAGHGHRATWLALSALSATVVLRSASTHSAALAVIANASGALVGFLYTPTTMTAVYNQAKSSPCTNARAASAAAGAPRTCRTASAMLAVVSPAQRTHTSPKRRSAT